MTAQKKPQTPAKSAREQFKGLDDHFDRQREARRNFLDNDMSDNLKRIADALPQMIDDEMHFRKQGTQLDTIKLREKFYGGGELARIKNIRIGVVGFQAIVTPYSQEHLESMAGFKDLVRACAAPEIDMNLRVYYDSSWASTAFEIQFDVPFDRNGRYKDMIAPLPAAPEEKPAAPAAEEAREMKRKPTHPGELLSKDILPALGMDAKAFAAKLGVETRTLNAVLKEKAPVTPDLAKKLSKTFGNSAQFWLNMQANHDGVDQPKAAARKPAAKKPAPKRRP